MDDDDDDDDDDKILSVVCCKWSEVSKTVEGGNECFTSMHTDCNKKRVKIKKNIPCIIQICQSVLTFRCLTFTIVDVPIR